MPRLLATLVKQRQPRQELRVHLEAVKDLGPGWEDAAAAAFLARVEQRIDAVVEHRVQERLRAARVRRGSLFRLVVCLFFATPLAFVAGQHAGLDGILAVLGAVLVLNWDMIIPG